MNVQPTTMQFAFGAVLPIASYSSELCYHDSRIILVKHKRILRKFRQMRNGHANSALSVQRP
jgi:hypothetical protein